MFGKWFDASPVEEILEIKTVDPSSVLMVDMGGNVGHDLQIFHQAYPNLPGRLIVQDLPGAISTVDTEAIKPVEAMAHDFFKPQPIVGAKAYYMKMVLHDWPDAQVKQILENLKPALKPGYSKILINEMVIPATNADWFSASLDMIMMLCHSATERREQVWHDVVESAGLKIRKIWTCGQAPEKLIEVVLADDDRLS